MVSNTNIVCVIQLTIFLLRLKKNLVGVTEALIYPKQTIIKNNNFDFPICKLELKLRVIRLNLQNYLIILRVLGWEGGQ